jgi:hypothetical protein
MNIHLLRGGHMEILAKLRRGALRNMWLILENCENLYQNYMIFAVNILE